MYSFDPKTKFLIISDSKLDNIITEYNDSDQYISYRKYLDDGLLLDVKNYLVPELNDILEEVGVTFKTDEAEINIITEKDHLGRISCNTKLSLVEENANNVYKDTNGELRIKIADKKLNSFHLLKLPYMDRGGIMSYDGKNYVIINSLTLEDALTYDGEKLKFVDSGNSLFIQGKGVPNVTMFKSTVTALELLIMLAKDYYGSEQGIEYSKDIIKSFRDNNIITLLSGSEKDNVIFGSSVYEEVLDKMCGPINDQRGIEFSIKEKIEEGRLSTITTRASLNEMLSFKNALGRVISRDITLSDGTVVVPEGEVINELVVSKLNNALIDTIYVRTEVNMVGQVIAEPIFLGKQIIQGTPVIPEMIELFPELSGYTIVPRTYEITNKPLCIEINTPITKELCTYLEYVGIDSFVYKNNESSRRKITAYFEEEYINNRHFPCSDLTIPGIEGFHGIVYVDKNGDIHDEQECLTCHDIAALTSLYMKLRDGKHFDLVSDPDSGLRKRVEQCYDHFHNAFIYSTTQFIQKTKRMLKQLVKECSTDLDVPDKMNNVFKFFGQDFWEYLRQRSKVISMLSITNPVDTISSLTKINTIVKDSNSISYQMRQLTMGHFGRICPYETPQSKKLGIVNNTALGCIIEDGVMYTQYYKLNHIGGKSYIDYTPIKMSISQEEKYRIGDISKLIINHETNEVTCKGKMPARVPAKDSLEKTTFASIDLKYVEYVNVSPNQHESIACSTVPYAGSDDAARLQFGVGMSKQSKGLVDAEIPMVCTTGFLNIPNMNTFYKVFAEDDGIILNVVSNSVTIRYDSDKGIVTYNFEPITLSSESIIIRVSQVVRGEKVKKEQTLVSSNFIKEGIMATGVNAIVAYMTDGYNYEDGMSVSERLSNKLTSYGVHTDRVKVSRKAKSHSLKELMYDSYLEKDDRMATLQRLGGTSNKFIFEPVRAHSCRGFIAKYDVVLDKLSHSEVTEHKIYSVSFDSLNGSDKICNRHGNKGVSCKISKNSQMPYLENGEFIDLKYNPNGVPTRMNVGQMFEAPCGAACLILGIRVLCDSFNSPSTTSTKRLLSFAVDLANSNDEEKVFSDYIGYPEELYQHCRENINNIRHWKNTFNKEGMAYLIDPISGKRTLNRVNIGINYIYKLVQEGEGKMHSRGGMLTSDYVAKTESPTKGASNGGGQRMGYMELDALASYGVQEYLKEITGERSDNYIARNNRTVEVLHSGESDYLIDEKFGIRRSTEYMIQLLNALGLKVECDDELDLENVGERIFYKRKALMDAEFGTTFKEEDIETKMFEGLKNLENKFK